MGRASQLQYGKIVLISETDTIDSLAICLKEILRRHGYPEASVVKEIVKKEEKKEEERKYDIETDPEVIKLKAEMMAEDGSDTT